MPSKNWPTRFSRSPSRKRATTFSRTTLALKFVISRSSSEKCHWNDKVKRVSVFRFRHYCKTKKVEDQNTTLEIFDRILEFQKEINCINEFKNFQDAESVEIPTLPIDQCHSHHIRFLKDCWGLLSCRRAAKEGHQAFGIHMEYRETFLLIHLQFYQFHIFKNKINGVRQSRNRSLHPQGRKVKGQNKIDIWDARLDRQPKIQSSSVEGILQIIMGQTNDRFRIFISTSSPHQRHLLAGRQDSSTCSQFPTEAIQWIKNVEIMILWILSNLLHQQEVF